MSAIIHPEGETKSRSGFSGHDANSIALTIHDRFLEAAQLTNAHQPSDQTSCLAGIMHEQTRVRSIKAIASEAACEALL